MSDEKSSYADRYHDEDAAASDSLLPTDENESATDSDKEEDLAEHSQPNSHGTLAYLKQHLQWIVLGALALAGICLILLKPPADTTPTHTASPSQLSRSGFSGPRNIITFLNGTQFVQPPEMKIIGIIFFGRRQFVKVLDCYLRRNLKINGGILDEIHFIIHTDHKADIEWLENLVESDNLEHYKLKREDRGDDRFHLWATFRSLYKQFMSDPNVIYVKVDDDVLFIDDYAIPELVRATLEHPEAYSVQANIVNNKWNQWHHFRTHAIWPYLPEKGHSGQPYSWRPSELPRYHGHLPGKNFKFDKTYESPPKGYRWLPLAPTYENLRHTPCGHRLRNPMNASREDETISWTVAAQSHYSFFENFERHELMRYDYGSGDDHTWNQWYTRYNVNLFAIRGSHVLIEPTIWNDTFHVNSDEQLMTIIIPRVLDMPALIATRAIAAHYSFHGDKAQLIKTDILSRYRALADELYCNGANPQDFDESESDDIGNGPQDFFNPEYMENGDDGDDSNYS